MMRQSDKMLTGNEAFEGYAIDLIKEVAEILSKLKADFIGIYTILLVSTKKYCPFLSFFPRIQLFLQMG